MALYPLLIAVTLSGAAGLMYQVAWTRSLISVTSATTMAQALILAVFMTGLGLGSLAAGRLSQRLRRPLVFYAWAELLAAGLSVAAFPLIRISVGLRETLPSDTGLYLELGLLSAYLLLPTTLLGASLPLLIEHYERGVGKLQLAGRGRLVGSLYGVNTVGAIVGSYLSGFVTIERVGLTLTGATGALLALGAAVIAVTTERRQGSRGPDVDPSPDPHRHPEPDLVLAALLAGFVGLAAEVFWLRLFALIIPNTVYTFAQVLMAVLAGISVGAFLAALAARLVKQPDGIGRLAGWAAAGGAVLIGGVPLVVVVVANQLPLQKVVAAGGSVLGTLTLLGCVLPAAGLVGAILPLLVTASRAASGSRTFGVVYGANTAGAVLGSLVTGLLLIPLAGLARTGAVVQAICLLLAALLLLRRSRRLVAVAGVVAAGGGCIGMFMVYDIPREIYRRRLAGDVVIRQFLEGRSSHVMVTDDTTRNERRLWINSFWVAGTGGPHRAFGHLPALFVERPRRALGIALGTGQTFAAVLDHGVTSIDCVEIDRGVIDLARRWFAAANDGLLQDPRVRVHTDDGRAFLRAARNKYDLIVLEPLQAWTAGTSNLYSKEFYQEARRILAAEGVLSQWIPLYGQRTAEVRSMVRTGLEVFPSGSFWLTGSDGILLLSNRRFRISLDAIQRRIVGRQGPTGTGLKRFPAHAALDLTAFMVLGPRGLRSWSRGAEILEDDHPFLEFRAADQIGTGHHRHLEALRSIRPHLDPMPVYAASGSQGERQALYAAQLVRDAAIAVRLLPRSARQEKLRRLNSLPPVARTFTLWRQMMSEVSRHRGGVR